MKRLTLILLIFGSYNLFGQNFNFDKFGKIIWQCTYTTDMTSLDLHKSLCTSSYLEYVEKIDDTFYYARLKRNSVDYEILGHSRMKLPVYISNNDVGNATVIIQYKEGKYRVTLKSIALLPIDPRFGYTLLHDVATGEDGYFTSVFMETTGFIYHENFKKWFDFEKVSNDW